MIRPTESEPFNREVAIMLAGLGMKSIQPSTGGVVCDTRSLVALPPSLFLRLIHQVGDGKSDLEAALSTPPT
jgi:hypothetical protein